MKFLTEEYSYLYLQKTLAYIAVYEAAFSMPDIYGWSLHILYYISMVYRSLKHADTYIFLLSYIFLHEFLFF